MLGPGWIVEWVTELLIVRRVAPNLTGALEPAGRLQATGSVASVQAL